VAIGASGAGGDGCDTAEVGEGGFRVQPVGIIPSSEQELASDLDADGSQGEPLWRGGGNQWGEFGVEFPDFLSQLLVAAQRGLGGLVLGRRDRQWGTSGRRCR